MAKRKSRSKRRDAECTAIRVVAESISNIAQSIRDQKAPTIEFMAGILVEISKLDLPVDTGELEALKEEIEEWRDNMPESLQGGDKYSTLDDTANTLESVVDELQSLEAPTIEQLTNQEELDRLADELEELAASIESQCDEADNAEFPGMMG